MKQGQELWYDALYLVGHEYLVAVQLNLVLLQLDVVLDFWEVEDTCEIEWVVYVQVNPEQRLVAHGVECAIEALVVLVLQGAWSLGPQGLHAVDDVVLVGFNLLAVFPFGLLTKGHGYSHELAVLVEQALELELIEELLAVIIYVQDDVRSVLLALSIVNLVGRTSVAAPLNSLRAFLPALGNNLNLLGYHEA